MDYGRPGAATVLQQLDEDALMIVAEEKSCFGDEVGTNFGLNGIRVHVGFNWFRGH